MLVSFSKTLYNRAAKPSRYLQAPPSAKRRGRAKEALIRDIAPAPLSSLSFPVLWRGGCLLSENIPDYYNA